MDIILRAPCQVTRALAPWIAVAVAMTSFQAHAAAPDGFCPGGWFAIEALVTAITPPGTLVKKRNAGENSSVTVKTGDVLCEGQILMFAEPGKGGTVELFQGDKQIIVESASREYELQGGLGHSISAAMQYVNGAFGAIGSLKRPAPRPSATAGRGVSGADSVKADHIRLIQPLAKVGSERQVAIVGTTLLLAWREGKAPYRCELLADDEVVWTGPPTDDSWCETAPLPAGIERVSVRDGEGQRAGMNLRTISVAELARPPWIMDSSAMDAGPNEAAWATWLWLERSDSQIAALSMFNASRREFIAGYVVEGILREDVPIRKP